MLGHLLEDAEDLVGFVIAVLAALITIPLIAIMIFVRWLESFE